jgi:O-methyltransferase
MEQLKSTLSSGQAGVGEFIDQSGYSYRLNKLYGRFIRPHLSRPIHQQRLKLVWNVWDYRHLLSLKNISLLNRLRLLGRFIVIDWHVVHGHIPSQIASICQYLSARPARDREIMIEAGCWNGGSSAKFSIICRMLNYKLHVYDSFQGVEELATKDKEYDFSGEYRAAEAAVRSNLRQYGEISECVIHQGWFKDTIAVEALELPVRVAYIDCDLAKGTAEVLAGVMPALVEDGGIFSEDFHIRSVREFLYDPETWDRFGRGRPTIRQLSAWPSGAMALLTFAKK